MYTYWLYNKSRPSLNINLNLWFLNSIRQYAVLNTATLSYFISTINSLKTINLKTVKTCYDFSIVYKYFLSSFLILFIILYVIV